jgi:type VI secretion system protein ImpL
MSTKGVVLVLFLYTAFVWVGTAYLRPGELVKQGLLLTAVGLGVTLAAALLSWIYGWWRVHRIKSAARPASTVAAPGLALEHPDNIALRELLREARARLLESPSFTGKTDADVFVGLPLYFIVGPEGSGKTQSFFNCGLDPQLLATQDAGTRSGAASTRLANIWLCANALFIEIGGRHFQGDAERWEQLLRVTAAPPQTSRWQRLLKPLLPGAETSWLDLRGMILVCDTKFLQSQSPDDVSRFGQLCQERFRATIKVFGRRFPVYTLFAKTDQVPYFSDFVGHFTEKEGNEIFGCTLALHDGVADSSPDVFVDAESKRLSRSFQTLYQSLSERRLSALFHEPLASKKPNIFEFPREFARFRPNVVSFLVQTFRPNPLHPSAVNRGFYFCGRREVAAAMLPRDQRSAPAGLAETMWDAGSTRILQPDATMLFSTTLDAEGLSGKSRGGIQQRWIFLTSLFRDVVLADRPLGRMAIVPASAQNPRRTAVLVAATAVSAIFVAAFTVSWFGNRDLLHRVESVAVRIGASNAESGLPSLDQLKRLDALRERVEELDAYRQAGPPLGLRWGLYAGNQVREAARLSYFRRLKSLLLDRANNQLALSLSKLPLKAEENAVPPSTDVRGRFKAHVMVSPSPDGCVPEAPIVSRQFQFALQEVGLGEGDGRYRLAARQVEFYATELPTGNPAPLPLNPEARDRAVRYLALSTAIEPYYRGLLAELAKSGMPPMSLADFAPEYAKVMNGPASIPGTFTPAGWEKLNALLHSGKGAKEDDPCIAAQLGGVQTSLRITDEVERQIQSLYARDVMTAWHGYLAGFSVIPYGSPDDAARRLETLAGHRSPLLALFRLTADGTNYAPGQPSQKEEEGLVEKGKRVIGKVSGLKKVEDAAKANLTPKAGPAADSQLTVVDIAAAFQPVRAVVPPASERWINEKNTAYVESLSTLRGAMQAIARTPVDSPDAQVHQAAMQAYDSAENNVHQLARAFNPDNRAAVDKEAERLLLEPIKLSSRFIIRDFGIRPKQKLEADLAKFCTTLRPLLQKYPFNPNGQDLALKDFSDYFAPQEGKLWKFQAGSLAELAVHEGTGWKANPAGKIKPSQELLDFLNRSQDITKAFYSDGGAAPRLVYSVRPKMDPNSDQVIRLRIDGQEREFSAASQLRQRFVWPASPGAPAGAVGRTGTRTSSAGFSSHEGGWAVFKFFGDAETRPARNRLIEWKKGRGPSGNFEPIEPPVRLEVVDFPGDVDVFNPSFLSGYGCPKKATQ